MSSLERPLSGDTLLFDLEEERDRTEDRDTLERSGRAARTLLKSGPLRVALVSIAPGGEIAEHGTDGPFTVQPLRGRIHFTAGDQEYDLRPGQLLLCGAGVRHAVSSEEGGAFMLTVAHEVADPRGET